MRAAPSQVSTLIQSFDKAWNDSDADKENDSTSNSKNMIRPSRFEHLRVEKSYDEKKGDDDESTVASVQPSPTMASFWLIGVATKDLSSVEDVSSEFNASFAWKKKTKLYGLMLNLLRLGFIVK